jgi:hypothetical protein
MLLKALNDLVGNEVVTTDGRCGVLEDVYFDRECWQLCYLLVADGAARTLVSAACVEAAVPGRGRVALNLSPEQIRGEAGAWRVGAALPWLHGQRVCSARELVGWRVAAEDGPAGELADLLLDPDTWTIDYVVALVRGAPGARYIALPLDWMDPLDPLERAVRMRCTRAQLTAAPQVSLASRRPAMPSS